MATLYRVTSYSFVNIFAVIFLQNTYTMQQLTKLQRTCCIAVCVMTDVWAYGTIDYNKRVHELIRPTGA